ncbi:MAG TPA: trypsin-like peptidase domain-containing protein, partial [Ktedonobacteraceae bacterium]|nr:trypsin-like peptidase domain-containing protein [Ktedonobacteraceae bacterium]
MPHDLDEIIQIKEAAEADLLQRPGVTGVDVGYKYVNGNVTDEIVIRVHVEEKKDVPPHEKIPETINGVKTDVLRTRIVATSDTNMYNPLLGGVNIGMSPTPFTGNLGTLGAIVIDNADATHGMLTNYHVLSHSDGQYVAGDVVTQPPNSLGGGVPAGLVTRGVMNAGADWDHAGEVDCALASVLPISWKNSRGSSNAIVDIGCVAGTAKPKLGETVRKRGFTSELTSGTIDSVALTTIVDMSHIGLGKRYFKNQISIRPDSSQPAFAQSGDSGSVVVNSTGQVIGLLFSADLTTGMGCANPIQTVMDNLNVRMAIDGIGGYDLKSSADRVFTFDYDGSGKLDHLVLYRPGTGIIWILKNTDGQFSPVFASGSGIGGYDLKISSDRVFAFDYDGSGKLDHLVLYRPGGGSIYILKNIDGQFSPVFASASG